MQTSKHCSLQTANKMETTVFSLGEACLGYRDSEEINTSPSAVWEWHEKMGKYVNECPHIKSDFYTTTWTGSYGPEIENKFVVIVTFSQYVSRVQLHET